jgi:itaconyl-CoA hydratase
LSTNNKDDNVRGVIDKDQFQVLVKGNKFEDFHAGQSFAHHWGRTIFAGDHSLFSAAVCNWNPMHLNAEYARSLGHPNVVVNPMMVLCTVVGLSVEDLSEAGGPFLGIDSCEFLATVYPDDTLTASSEVISARRSKTKDGYGIVTWRTKGYNQHGVLVVEFVRTNLVATRGSDV